MRRMQGGSAVRRVFRYILSCEGIKLEVETRENGGLGSEQRRRW